MATRKIKSTEEHTADIIHLHKVLTKEQREFKRLQLEAERYEYLRDDLCSLIKNSGVADEIIHARGGPTPQTLRNWRERKVNRPMASKMQSAGRAIGLQLTWSEIKER